MTNVVNSRSLGFVKCALVRCDGAPEIGLGHIVRCVALAQELREQHGCRVRFLIRRGPLAVQMVEKAGFQVEQPTDIREDEAQWISRVLHEQKADAIVMDFRAPMSPDAVWEWRRQGVLTVTIDDPEAKRVACDLVFFPPVPQVRRMSWEGFTGELHAGWEWVLLRRQFADLSPAIKTNLRPVVLVAMGGSDPAGLNLKALKALELLTEDFETVVVLGSAFCHKQALERFLSGARRHFEIRRNVLDMAGVMAKADLAVASFGVTAYELAALGVPGIYLCLTDDHAESASVFDAEGMGISLGVSSAVTGDAIAATAQRLITDPAALEIMSRKCRRLASAQGAANIARKITTKLEAAYERK